ncbi:hypothetical protein HanRHA438_Chr13g0627111 [Helianthus annuus]|nr:hypothetical protein HanRHA438_Chr13g0627111 [Helianthus annuus]
MFARMKREKMSCKRGSDEVNERRRSERERVEDGYGMGRSIHADGEPFKSTIRGKDEIPSMKFATRADDEEDVRSKEDESRIRE